MRRYFYNLMTDRNNSIYAIPVKAILWLLSLIYGAILRIRDVFYDSGLIRAQAVPEAAIISIGNITVGGTGKTPLAIRLAQRLKEQGKKVGVVIRGYGEDEFMLLEKSLTPIPIIKDKDRLRAAHQAIGTYKLDTVIMDDGFQYRRLRKDFNILAVDSSNPFGNGCLLPRGILRDRIISLKKADALVMTKADCRTAGVTSLEERLSSMQCTGLAYRAFHKPEGLYDVFGPQEYPLSSLRGKKIAALSSIGDPGYFYKLLKDAGAEVAATFPFMDHHRYTQRDLDSVISAVKEQGIDCIVTTEKDMVKLAAFTADKTITIMALAITIAFYEGEDDLIDRLCRIHPS